AGHPEEAPTDPAHDQHLVTGAVRERGGGRVVPDDGDGVGSGAGPLDGDLVGDQVVARGQVPRLGGTRQTAPDDGDVHLHAPWWWPATGPVGHRLGRRHGWGRGKSEGSMTRGEAYAGGLTGIRRR